MVEDMCSSAETHSGMSTHLWNFDYVSTLFGVTNENLIGSN